MQESSDKKKGTGSLMFVQLEDLVTKFARYNDLANYSILVVSTEIGATLKVKSSIGSVATGVSYESKYDNIEFVDSIRPPASALEYAYDQRNRKTFLDKYESFLLSVEPFTDICAIVDMVVNECVDVIIVVSVYEHAGDVHGALRDFILGEFGLQGYKYEELERLIGYYGKEEYPAIVKTIGFEIPDEFDGEDVTAIVKNIGNVDKIRERLEMQKEVAATMNAEPGEETDITTIFFNRFTEDLQSKVKELLMRRTDDDIKDMCRERGIRITKSSSKELLIDKILHEMKLDRKRVKDYDN